MSTELPPPPLLNLQRRSSGFDFSRPKTAQKGPSDLSRPSQRLAAEAFLKPEPSVGLLQLQLAVTKSQITKSAVGFDSAKQSSAKDFIKKQKQAWDSPPDTPGLPRAPLSRRGMKKVCHQLTAQNDFSVSGARFSVS